MLACPTVLALGAHVVQLQLNAYHCGLQVKFIFGYNSRPNPANTTYLTLPSISFPRHNPIHEQLADLFGGTWTPYFAWREFAMGACWLVLLFTMRYFGQKYR